ncbi:MAG: FtsX-like permease family protein, partial [Bacillota bacterium]|nr:FtsX-like permease family protein [Bacillota bacterium]
MQSLSQLSRRYLRRQWKRTAFTGMGIIMATALFAGVALLFTSLVASFITTEAQSSGTWHYHVTGLTTGQADQLQANIRISQSAQISVSHLYGRLPQEVAQDRPGSGENWLILRDAAVLQTDLVPYVRTMSGRLPERTDEIALDSLSLAKLQADGIGDQVTLSLNTYRADAAAGKDEERTYTIVGLIPWLPSNLPDDVFNALTIVPEYEKQLSEVYLTVKPGLRYEETLFAALADILPGDERLASRQVIKYGSPDIGKLRVRTHDSLLRYYGQTTNDDINRQLLVFFGILAGIIMVSVILVIRNSFSMSVTERTSEFGLLRVVGASPSQVRRLVLQDAIQLAVVGIPLGLLAGIAAMAVTIHVVSSVDLPVIENLELVVSSWPLLIAGGLSLLSIMIAAIKPAVRAGSLAPVEAIRRSGAYRIQAKKEQSLRRKGKISRFVLGCAGTMAGRNVRRDQKRFRATALSVGVSVVLFLSAGGISLQMRAGLTAFNSEQTDFSLSGRSGQTDLGWNPVLSQAVQALQGQTTADRLALSGRISMQIPLEAEQFDQSIINAYIKYADVSGQDIGSEEAAQQILHDGVLYYHLILADRPLLNELGLKDPDAAWNALASGQALLCQTGSVNIGGISGATVAITNFGRGDLFPMANLTRADENGNVRVLLQTPATIAIAEEITQLPWFFAGTFSSLPILRLIVSRDYVAEHFIYADDLALSMDQVLAVDADEGHEKEVQAYLTTLADGQTDGSEPGQADLYLTDHYTRLLRARNTMFVMDVFIYGFAVVIILICAMNILNIVTTNILLRRRELAVLQAVGMSRGQLVRMLLLECSLYGLTGAFWGTAIGFALLALITRQADGFISGSALSDVP